MDPRADQRWRADTGNYSVCGTSTQHDTQITFKYSPRSFAVRLNLSNKCWRVCHAVHLFKPFNEFLITKCYREVKTVSFCRCCLSDNDCWGCRLHQSLCKRMRKCFSRLPDNAPVCASCMVYMYSPCFRLHPPLSQSHVGLDKTVHCVDALLEQ